MVWYFLQYNIVWCESTVITSVARLIQLFFHKIFKIITNKWDWTLTSPPTGGHLYRNPMCYKATSTSPLLLPSPDYESLFDPCLHLSTRNCTWMNVLRKTLKSLVSNFLHYLSNFKYITKYLKASTRLSIPFLSLSLLFTFISLSCTGLVPTHTSQSLFTTT